MTALPPRMTGEEALLLVQRIADAHYSIDAVVDVVAERAWEPGNMARLLMAHAYVAAAALTADDPDEVTYGLRVGDAGLPTDSAEATPLVTATRMLVAIANGDSEDATTMAKAAVYSGPGASMGLLLALVQVLHNMHHQLGPLRVSALRT